MTPRTVLRPPTIEAVSELIGIFQYHIGLECHYSYQCFPYMDCVTLIIGTPHKHIEKHYVTIERQITHDQKLETVYPITALLVCLDFPISLNDPVRTDFGLFPYAYLVPHIFLRVMTQFAANNQSYMQYQYLKLHSARE